MLPWFAPRPHSSAGGRMGLCASAPADAVDADKFTNLAKPDPPAKPAAKPPAAAVAVPQQPAAAATSNPPVSTSAVTFDVKDEGGASPAANGVPAAQSTVDE